MEQGWTGKFFFHGAGHGKSKNLRGGAVNGPKSAGLGGEYTAPTPEMVKDLVTFKCNLYLLKKMRSV